MIEVGEYVRLKNGKIIKFKKFSTSKYSRYRGADLRDVKTIIDTKGSHFKYDNIVKHSKNIIDLIEAGDYIDGNLVVEHAHNKGKLYITATYIGGKGVTTFEDCSCSLETYIDIESIVTKEQFKNIEYRLED